MSTGGISVVIWIDSNEPGHPGKKLEPNSVFLNKNVLKKCRTMQVKLSQS